MRLLLTVLLSTQLAAAPAPQRPSVEHRFQRVRELARGREKQLFAMFSPELPAAERDALQFLYANMPLQDLADQEGALFHRAVKATLAARVAMPWGPRIPEGIFKAYVLPLRVNTENLDDARPVFWEALRDRVKGLSMEAAALEVNHWCHEHVTYRSADARTSGPLATLRTTWGRCGEESTLLVAALRAVAIPARQVYTPRWAHQDDNHAWVEAWIDGTWHFLGACEPAPALDMAWFREPARRAMMVHTKAYGGDPEGLYNLRHAERFDEAQLLPRYAPSVERTVKVVDHRGRPVKAANVEFGLYNYAEFYPLATRETDATGRVSLLTGKGDLRLRVRKGDLEGTSFMKASAKEGRVRLMPFRSREWMEALHVQPPVEPMPRLVEVPDAARERTRLRLAEGDRLRNAISAAFLTEPQAAPHAGRLGLEPGKLWPLLQKSQGNHAAILAFLEGVCPERRDMALALLATVSDKDLRDTPADVLADHLEAALRLDPALLSADPIGFQDHVLCPRIHQELLTPWRSGLEKALPGNLLARFRRVPAEAVTWVRERIRLDTQANSYGVPMRPLGTLTLGVADPLGRDILLIALLRTAGVQARMEPGSFLPQYRQGQDWITVRWETDTQAAPARVRLRLAGAFETNPVYGVHFALARRQDGRYETLDFEGQPWSWFQKGLELEPGDYCLTTSDRASDGSVRVRRDHFPLRTDRTRPVVVLHPPSRTTMPPTRLDLASLALTPFLLDRTAPTSATGGACALPAIPRQGLILAWIGLNDEPSLHALLDLALLTEPIEKWGGGLVLVLGQTPQSDDPALDRLRRLASQTRVMVDDGTARNAVLKALRRPAGTPLPCILGLSAQGDVHFLSEGYRIGVGEQVLRAIRRLDMQR